MITLGEFIRNGKAEDETLVDFHLGLNQKENDMLEKFCGKKEYGDDAERYMLREDILAEFERRLELDI